MTDQTIETLRKLQVFAEENGGVVDRVEVSLRDHPDGTLVGFVAHLKPRLLPHDTAALGYIVPNGSEAN